MFWHFEVHLQSKLFFVCFALLQHFLTFKIRAENRFLWSFTLFDTIGKRLMLACFAFLNFISQIFSIFSIHSLDRVIPEWLLRRLRETKGLSFLDLDFLTF